MAYIAPNTNIKLLRNVPLEPDYINTLYFATTSAQTTYFTGKAKYNLTAQSYQRVNRGVCRVNYKAEDVYDCNYMMFQNTSFGTKWFYAFITSIDYINNVTCDIHYEIDVMQTWLKDISLRMCFVEREHSGSDNIGDNIMPEPLAIGELVFNSYGKITTDLDNLVVNVLTNDTDGGSGWTIDGVYSGALIKSYGSTFAGNTNLRAYLNTFNSKPDAIVGMYMCPAWCIGNYSQETLDDGVITAYQSEAKDEEYSASALTGNETIDGHIVRNKKLFTYPYNFYHIDNANGRELSLRYEFFTDDDGHKNLTPQFKVIGNICMPVTVVLRPMNYKGVIDDDYIRTESIDLNNYPMCSWNMDSWKAWVAQDSIPEAISAVTSFFDITGSAGSSYMMGSLGELKSKPDYERTNRQNTATIVQGAGASISLVGNIVSKMYSASIKADILKGSLNNGNVNVASKNQTFFGGRVSVNNQQAKIIDDFFDRYGYATNELKVPNITSRQSWNYVKTIGSNVDGNIPGDDKRIIDANFDRGITFWHDPTKVDDYSQNNAPVSP